MTDKIRATHLERTAYVYVRQSSMHQVREHQESRRRQYELVDHSRQLGFRQVVTVDDDLGRSAAGLQERPGFARLVAAVCRGEAGAVVALEASRLARNNRDWHYLIDFCGLTDTLVIDQEGVYDPRLVNDRLLLGLKGTMSEFELSLLRQRAHEALRAKIRRGEALWELPVGYVRTEDNAIEMTPDRQVQEAVRSVFAQFRELGSARQVLLWFRQNGILLPVSRPRSRGREVEWRAACQGRVLALLKNPCYAGSFAYGRRQTKTVIVDEQPRKKVGSALEPAAWDVLLVDHHPGYITWPEYLHNQERLVANLAKHHATSRGAARAGSALLAGLLRCARCGRKLHAGYSGPGSRVARYYCRGGALNHGTPACISVGALRLDSMVAAQVLEVLEPIGVEAALAAWEELRQQESEKGKALRLAVEKADYEVARARRQYDAVEPENRLVAAELEARWNQALEVLRAARSRLQETAMCEPSMGAAERQRLLALGADVRALWDHPAASMALKKRLVRSVLEEIIVDLQDTPPEVALTLHWAGGVHTPLRLRRNPTGRHGHCTDGEAIDVVRQLAEVCGDAAIAAILNRLGYRTGVGNTWTEARVASLRDYNAIAVYDAGRTRAWITLAEAAQRTGVSATVIRRLIRQGALPARQVVPQAPWVIDPADLELAAVRHAIRAVQTGRPRPRTATGQTEMSFRTTT